MSAKNLDHQGRWRSKTVAFRVSPEEDALIEKKVALSGLTKQEYITRRLQEEEMQIPVERRADSEISGVAIPM